MMEFLPSVAAVFFEIGSTTYRNWSQSQWALNRSKALPCRPVERLRWSKVAAGFF